jgi:hypothetical protein
MKSENQKPRGISSEISAQMIRLKGRVSTPRVWPNDPRLRSTPTVPPSIKTLNWIRSRQIAYAKSRERAVG